MKNTETTTHPIAFLSPIRSWNTNRNLFSPTNGREISSSVYGRTRPTQLYNNAPERWNSDTSEAEDKVKAGEDGQTKEPEPQEEEHLMIHSSTIVKKKKNWITFSLTMFRERIQRLLNFCSPAAVPTEWKVQLEKKV